jgi:hypothetical protein
MCTGLIHGRMLVAAWEEGVESCEDQVRINCGTCASKKFNLRIIIFNIRYPTFQAVSLTMVAVQHFLRLVLLKNLNLDIRYVLESDIVLQNGVSELQRRYGELLQVLWNPNRNRNRRNRNVLP